MAQFYGSVASPGRIGAHCLGHKPKGLEVQARGWHAGVTIRAEHVDGKDVFTVFLNGGSEAPRVTREICTVIDGTPIFSNDLGVKA